MAWVHISEMVVIQASQFTPVAFEATLVGFKLTKSLSRLTAELLKTHGNLTDDVFGSQEELRLFFRDRGLLTVTPSTASFGGWLSQDLEPATDWDTQSVEWAVELLTSILNFQKSKIMALQFETTWELPEESSTSSLVEHFGLSHALSGLFVKSQDFQIQGDTTIELPELFPVDCDVSAGQLNEYNEQEKVGVHFKYWSPDSRLESDAFIDYTLETVDRFYTLSPQMMAQQLAQYFPNRGNT